MYTIKQYQDKYEMYELKEENTNSWFRVCPERGGIITSFGVDGQELFYLDEETFYNIDSNIRGGNPILFPICGQLAEGKYELNGKTYHMKNHGVARTNPWEVVETSDKDKAAIKIRLKSNEETKKEFNFDFELVFTYILKNGKLTIAQEYINKSKETMPLQAGFHPYFKAKEKNISYKIDAEKYLDHNDMIVKDYKGSIDLTNMVESAGFMNAKESRISFELPGMNREIILTYGDEFKYIVIWSVKDKEFVCVEPWTAKNGALNTGEGLRYLEAGQSLETYFSIEAVCK